MCVYSRTCANSGCDLRVNPTESLTRKALGSNGLHLTAEKGVFLFRACLRVVCWGLFSLMLCLKIKNWVVVFLLTLDKF